MKLLTTESTYRNDRVIESNRRNVRPRNGSEEETRSKQWLVGIEACLEVKPFIYTVRVHGVAMTTHVSLKIGDEPRLLYAALIVRTGSA